MRSNGHNYRSHNGRHVHNGHNGRHESCGRLLRNGHPADNGHIRRIAGSCPKCEGFVLDRYDPYVGWEPYCLNCGWTPLTSLEVHVIPETELRAIAQLRRWGKRWVSFNPDVFQAERN